MTDKPTPSDHDTAVARSTDRSGARSKRPRSVYIVLAIGVTSLLILLIVIYLSNDQNVPDQPICTTVQADDARQAVLEGRIRRVTLAYDETVEPPSDREWGPVLVRLDYTDGQCANLPQGIARQNDMYELIGAITVFNDITENTRIEITYDRETELDPALFATPTEIPTQTPSITPTRTPSTGSPGASPTPSGTPGQEGQNGVFGPHLNTESTPEGTPIPSP